MNIGLITIDTVLEPSGPGCYINDIICEQKDYMINEHGIIVECAYNKLEKNLRRYHTTHDKAKKETYMLKAFNEFLESIKQ